MIKFLVLLFVVNYLTFSFKSSHRRCSIIKVKNLLNSYVTKKIDEIINISVEQCSGKRLPAVNYYHKALHLGCCSSSRSASATLVSVYFVNPQLRHKIKTNYIKFQTVDPGI